MQPALSLPSLTGIPHALTVETGSRMAARAALSFLELGLLTDADARRDVSVALLVAIALERWLKPRIAGLRICPVRLHATDEHETTGVEIIWTSETITELAYTFTLAGAVNALQRAHPGLGETALWHLQLAWWYAPGRPFLPSHARDLAEQWIWQGEPDERAVIEELKAQGEHPADIDVLTSAQLDRIIPTWAQRPTRRVKQRELARIARRHPRSLSGKVAALCLEIAEFQSAHKSALRNVCSWPDWSESGPLGYSVFARWTPVDPCAQLVDYEYDMGSQDGADAIFGADAVAPDRKSIRRWMDNAAHAITLLGLAERLTFLIGDARR